MPVWFNELETDPTENNAFFLRYNIDFDLDSKCVVELQENGTIVRQFGNYRTVIMAA